MARQSHLALKDVLWCDISQAAPQGLGCIDAEGVVLQGLSPPELRRRTCRQVQCALVQRVRHAGVEQFTAATCHSSRTHATP